MMAPMPRPRPPHLNREISRHGKTTWYVRIGQGPRVRIRAEFGTEDFDLEYRAALAGRPMKRGAPDAKSLAWLVERYRETSAWLQLSNATRRQRENIFRHVLAKAGAEPFARISTQDILSGIERRMETPAQARNFLGAMRGLFKWAAKAKHVRSDATAGIETPQRPKTAGFIPWTEEYVTAYEARWPIGTRQRVWLDVLLYTGLRRGDAVRLGRQHVRDGIATIKTEKSGQTVEVALPILPVLAKTLKAGPCGELTFICGERGQPMPKESFGNEFRIACNKANVPGSAHGVRKLAATRMAENGATEKQLQAVFGWTDSKMPALYTKGADRRRLAKESAHMLVNDQATSIPAPNYKVRERKGKTK